MASESILTGIDGGRQGYDITVLGDGRLEITLSRALAKRIGEVVTALYAAGFPMVVSVESIPQLRRIGGKQRPDVLRQNHEISIYAVPGATRAEPALTTAERILNDFVGEGSRTRDGATSG